MKLGVSTYSYWHFKPDKYPIESVFEHAASMQLSGVEILHRQMDDESVSSLQKLKRRAFELGLDLYALSIHQDFVYPTAEERRSHILHTCRCIELAHEMGIPSIRLNSGRWKTIKTFDELMKVGGIEPPLDGYTEDDAFDWVTRSIEACLPHAERHGVILALENHWGLTVTADGVLRIVAAFDTPWLRVCLDTGNLLLRASLGENPQPDYDGISRLAQHAVLVHAKTYFGGGEWYTVDIDYRHVFQMLHDVNFRGYISLEYEGKEDPETGVRRSVDLLRDSCKS